MGIHVVGEGHGNERGEAREPHVPAHVPLREAIPEQPPQEGPGHTWNPEPEEGRTNIRAGEIVGAHEESGDPVTHAIAYERMKPAPNGHVAEAFPRPEGKEHLFHRRQRRLFLCRFGHFGFRIRHPAHRLPEGEAHQKRQPHPGHAHEEEGRAPVKGVVNPTPKKVPQHGSHGNAEGIDPEGRRASVGGENIGNHGVGRGTASSLTHGNPNAAGQELNKASGEAAERGHTAPDGEAYGEDISAHAPIREARNGNA